MRWYDGLGGLLIMLAAMVTIMVFALPVFEDLHSAIFSLMVLPLAVFGVAIIFYGHYWKS